MPQPPALTHLLYLHGFRSSPESAKARQMAEWASGQAGLAWLCPALPPSPREAFDLIQDLTADWPGCGAAVVGSSLGGYYAAALANGRRGWRAGLLNPAVNPARDLATYIGEQRYWHKPEEAFYFQPDYVNELQALHAGPLQNPRRWFALIAKGDELLDWREMLARYGGGRTLLLDRSDHALSDFPRWQAELTRFLTDPTPV